MNAYLQFLRMLTRSEKRRLTLLLLCAVAMSFVDVVGMSSILPFLSVAADPDIVNKNSTLAYVYAVTGATSLGNFVFILGVAALIVVVISNLIAFLSQWAVIWYSFDLGRSVSTRLFRSYVAQPYEFYLPRNSMNLTLNSTDEVEGIINGILLPWIQIVGKATTALFILLLIVAYDPRLAIVFIGVIGGAYALIFIATRRYVERFGERGHDARRARFRRTKEAFGAIKEIRILDREDGYVDRFIKTSAIYSRNFAFHSILALAPRYALETLGIAAMLVVILSNASSVKDLATTIPTMILYAVAGYRLMPAFQAIFGSLTTIRFNRPSLDIIAKEISALRGASEVSSAGSTNFVTEAPLKLTEAIVFKSVSSRYAEAEEPTLKDVNLIVPVRQTIGIVGTSGAGKSTFIDVLTGLLPVESGKILIDSTVLSDSNVRAWRKSIGYVPQQIYLADDNIRNNIAFGVPESEVDHERVERAARLACIHDFIIKETPAQYQTMIGENGTRLSGGQRQRLGIARALYRDPPVLILDEATSALDGITEDAVIEAIRQLASKKTIVIIAHRLATVQSCDSIYMLEGGRVVDQGSYADLLRRNDVFRQMAKVTL